MSDETNALSSAQDENAVATETETKVEAPENGENPAAKAKPAEQDENSGDEADEAAAKDAKDPDKARGDDDAKNAKKTRAQERIQQLVERAKEAERRAEAAERRVTELQGKDDPRPNPNDEKYYSDPDAYSADLNAWTLRNMRREDVAENAKADKQQAAQARVEAFQARVEAFADEVPDFEEFAFRRAPINDAQTADLIMESDLGPQIAYYLGKNPAEARDFAGMSMTKKALFIGRLEERLTAPPAAPKRVTQAPEPIVPAAGTRSPTKLRYDPNMSMADYAKWRKQQGIE